MLFCATAHASFLPARAMRSARAKRNAIQQHSCRDASRNASPAPELALLSQASARLATRSTLTTR
eukprot:5079947-Pleurochrysis_carterae.AAC.1